ncbi:MAG TPA: Uma2 family endonuclease [Mycobacteriales bacterium]|nr:Uma2 family endonuclease [Mycobacteriales bacterium]
MVLMVDIPQLPVPLLPLGREWTVDDLELLPDDGLRYELIDGALLVSPSPFPPHQRAARAFFRLLDALCPADAEVFFAPLDFQPDQRNSLVPDVLVVRREDVGPKKIHRPLLLAVEVLSASSRRRDMLFKRSVYEDAGVASYWMFDPTEPSLLACELVDGRYVEKVRATGEGSVHLDRPFPVRLCPAELAVG